MFKHFATHEENAPPGWAGWTVDQGWDAFTPEEHETWNLLAARQSKLLEGRIVAGFMEGLATLGLAEGGIPELGSLNARLAPLTGWRCVAVAGLVPDDIFFAMLAERIFPVGNFIRTRAQLDYLEEPDCFHDIFGHVPMLACKSVADAMQKFGETGVAAIASGEGAKVARMYWHTIEFGLVREGGELRILGAGLASSFGEAAKSLEDAGIERRRFTPASAVATPYRHDAMQPLYLVADDMDAVVAALEGPLP